jgi:hypothetical protein
LPFEPRPTRLPPASYQVSKHGLELRARATQRGIDVAARLIAAPASEKILRHLLSSPEPDRESQHV